MIRLGRNDCRECYVVVPTGYLLSVFIVVVLCGAVIAQPLHTLGGAAFLNGKTGQSIMIVVLKDDRRESRWS